MLFKNEKFWIAVPFEEKNGEILLYDASTSEIEFLVVKNDKKV